MLTYKHRFKIKVMGYNEAIGLNYDSGLAHL